MEENIPKGYENIEVGIIPDDWDVRELGSISKVVRGGSPRPAGDPKFFGGIYIPWLTVAALTNIPESSIYVSQTIGFLTEEGAKYSRTLENGTLIIANSGATLGVAKILAVKCCANDGIAAFIDLNKDADKLFLYYVLNAKTKEFREVVATGNGQPNLNTTLIGLTKISFPSTIEEQKAIAQSLSDVDALITECDRLITKKRNTKQGTMQQLLTGKKRLPGFSGEWEINKLENISSEIGDGIHSTPKYVEFSEFYFINGNNLIKSSIQITDQTKCVSEEEFCKYKNILNDRTILISINGTIGNIAFFNNEKVILGKSAAYINVKKAISKNYIFYFLQTYTINCYFEDELTGSTIRNLSLKSIRNTPISIPPTIEEQKAIAQILSDMDAEIEGLEQKRDKYKAIKQGMMQELLTGKTRLISSS
ncbi:restriction endonuclease subunit S [Nostoc sp. FACHB-133]|uniref:restriction endonuclease subunit S n=1 Tax=Nostoc sp. FACHB-133 TaxID=2692835 RepID=UPI001F54B72E|nr:restriction endonuclease subunit S [Nostoc sp. FACHB-133]